MSTPLTSDRAIALLRDPASSYKSPEALRALAAQVDADSPGHLSALYSGDIDAPKADNLAMSIQEAVKAPQQVCFSNLRNHCPSPSASR